MKLLLQCSTYLLEAELSSIVKLLRKSNCNLIGKPILGFQLETWPAIDIVVAVNNSTLRKSTSVFHDESVYEMNQYIWVTKCTFLYSIEDAAFYLYEAADYDVCYCNQFCSKIVLCARPHCHKQLHHKQLFKDIFYRRTILREEICPLYNIIILTYSL